MEKAPNQDQAKQDWKAKCLEIDGLVGELWQEIKRLHPEKAIDQSKHHDDIRRECLRVLGEEARQYAAWHCLIGSTPDYRREPLVDFPGEQTIVSFLKRKIQELKETKEEKN